MKAKEKIPLIVGLAIPVLMIIFVAASIYVPGLFIKPAYNFIYTTSGYPTYYVQQGQQFIPHILSIRDGRLLEEIGPASDHAWLHNTRPVFYMYDVQTDTNKELSLAEVQQLHLDSSKESPDGFEISYGSTAGGIFPFFWSERDYDKRYLKGRNVSKQIKIKTGSDSYYDSFQLVGWVIE